MHAVSTNPIADLSESNGIRTHNHLVLNEHSSV